MQSTVTLKSGEEVRTSLKKTVMLALQSLMKNHPVAFYEMVMLCRDPDHEIWGDMGETLQDWKLVKPNGKVRPEVREIVLNAVKGEDMDMQLVSPVAEDKPSENMADEKIRAIDDYDFFLKVRKVADRVFEFVEQSDEDLWLEDRRRQGVNPVYNQTADGMFLEMSYDSPSKLWTPWGSWGFAGGASGPWIKNPMKSFLQEVFDITTHQERRNTKMGPIGPVYALHSIGTEELPAPRELRDDAYDDSQDIREAWRDLYGRYLNE